MRNDQNDQKTVNCVKNSFSIKLTIEYKENQGWNILYIRGYGVTYAGFRSLQLLNFMRTDQNNTKLCSRLCLHKVIKIMT